MSAITDIHPIGGTFQAPPPARLGTLGWAVVDALVLAKRTLLQIRRVPEQLLDVTLQPIMFVLLFRYVFGGAIDVGGTSYVNFLIPGIIVQTLAFSGFWTSVGLAEDLQRGLIDRFRSLPMSRSAVLAGRTLADLVRAVLGMVVMLTVGLIVGFRPQGSPLGWLAAIGLMLVFAFAFLWIGALAGVLVRNSQSAQAVGFIALFPLTFASSAFVPTQTMPGPLRAFAEHQPVTATVNAARALFLGQPVGNAAWEALAWCAAILLVFAPTAVWFFRRKTAG